MKRVQLFEFEDFVWFPRAFRSSMTRLIAVFLKMLKVREILAELIANALTESGETNVVDLGSGSGGCMPDVMRELHSMGGFEKVEMTLSDRYPDPKTIEALDQLKIKGLKYASDSVDAGQLETAPKGLKTMINSFHHMPPDVARKILASAKYARQPILIYEMVENKMPLWFWWLQLPLSLSILMVMTLFMTPFARPISLSQIIFTYVVPIIPIAYAWDGQASYPRMYALKDFDELLAGLNDEGYTWKVESAVNSKGKKLGYFVLGMPR